jgi:hypothetical protein
LPRFDNNDNRAILWQDNNGTIENEELGGFLKDLLELAKKVRCIISGSEAVLSFFEWLIV